MRLFKSRNNFDRAVPRFPWAARGEEEKWRRAFSWDVGHRFKSTEDILSIDRQKGEKRGWRSVKCVYEWGIPRTWPSSPVHLRAASAFGDTPFRFDDFTGVCERAPYAAATVVWNFRGRRDLLSPVFPAAFTMRTEKSVTKFNAPRLLSAAPRLLSAAPRRYALLEKYEIQSCS